MISAIVNGIKSILGFFQSLFDVVANIGQFVISLVTMVTDLLSGIVALMGSVLKLPQYIGLVLQWMGPAGAIVGGLVAVFTCLVVINMVSKAKP